MRMNHVRPRKPATIARKRAVPLASLNCIESHEQSIASVQESAADRFESVHARLKAYQQRQSSQSRSSRKQHWIKQRRELERDEVKLSKEINAIYSNLNKCRSSTSSDDEDGCDMNIPFSMIMIDQQATTRTWKSSTTGWNELHAKLVSLRKSSKGSTAATQTHALKHELDVQMERLEEESKRTIHEVQKFRQIMKRLESSDKEENTQKLPMDIANAVEDLRAEFHLVGLERESEVGDAIERQIDEVTSCLSVELSKLDDSRKTHDDGSIADKYVKHVKRHNHPDRKLDEQGRLILRNSLSEYKKIGVGDKRIMLRALSKETKRSPSDIKKELEKMLHERHARTRRKDERLVISVSRAQIIESTLDKIRGMKIAFIECIMGDFDRLVKDEISEERDHRMEILRSMRVCIEERQREEEARMEALESEELARESIKRQQDLAIAKSKLSRYMELKEREMRMMEAEELKRQNDDDEARIKRLIKNGERVNFRRQERQKKEIENCEKVQKFHQAELDRQRKLNALASSVPYFQTIKSMKPDVFRSTECRRNDIFEPSSESGLANFQMGLTKLTGFTNEKVFSDAKFRLAHQLHEAGVASSAYSCAVVRRLIPRQTERTTGIEPY